jgi:hypothetical protein
LLVEQENSINIVNKQNNTSEHYLLNYLKYSIMSKYGFSFSWKRALGISAAKRSFARQIEISTTQSGLERKVGRGIISLLLSLFTVRGRN